ncbi:glycosyltransferase family 2 protein [Pedobacter frigidisoli]|uniref:Glycosyltransferase family 2 protein n=1 Tax=Pedobacter frigidisoli TaxID=2530455 RepID=A0A4R0NZV7_9SPHI|nr:glycosyltransferase family A protein [Pedobacter frigidisoli]TCD07735.1 glycosyltransferase family 2 protein [Pedobacter frigidisoli]
MYKLTAIICVFNEERSLITALRSLRMNKIYHETEIILIDDFSTNVFTRKLLKRIAKFTRAKVLYSIKNEGLSHSRNLGFSNASSPYVVPIDADDILPDGALDDINECFIANPDADFIFGNYQVESHEGLESKLVSCSDICTNGIINSQKLAANWKLLGTSPCKKATWEAIGGYSMKYSYSVQDVDFWIRVMQRGFKGVYTDKCIYIWNRSEKGMNMTFDRIFMTELLNDHQSFYSLILPRRVLVNKIFEGYYPYKQSEILLPFAHENLFQLQFKNLLRVFYFLISHHTKKNA